MAKAEEELKVAKQETEGLKVTVLYFAFVSQYFLQAKTKRLKQESKEKSSALNAYAVWDGMYIKVGSCLLCLQKEALLTAGAFAANT